nr:uncharacterized protein LOC116765903 isoform X3 [Danaus plexippus plexippus]
MRLNLQVLERRGYSLERRGAVEVKGKGRMETWWVQRGRRRAGPLPAPAPPRSLAALVYTMLQARKRIYTHPLDGPQPHHANASGSNSIRRQTTRPGTARHNTEWRRAQSRIETGMVARRPEMAPPVVGSMSAPHTPTTSHVSPERMFAGPKLGLGARLKAASFSYRSRPNRDRSPKIRESTDSSAVSPANGAPGSFRFRSVTTASFFRSKNKDRRKDQDTNEESGDTVTTRM